MRPAILFLLILLIHPPASTATDAHVLDGQWQVGVGFGEIPIMAGSFKPALSVGYHVDQHLILSLEVQARDHLQRDDSSFNARNTGLDGLVSSTETTGTRVFLGVRVRPSWRLPYLNLGLVYNDADTEIMSFDNRERQFASGPVTTDVVIRQTRPAGTGLALGVGYQYDVGGSLSVNTGIALALLSPVPLPDIDVQSSVALSAAGRTALESRLRDAYRDNLHNHYHLFSLGLGLRFD